MRTIPIFAARAEGDLVQALNAANPVALLRAVKDDKLRLVVHDVARNTATPAVPLFVEQNLQFASMRASIGLVDAAPKRGTFKLQVAGQTTALLTWPTDLSTDALRAAWKLAVLNALKALSNVGSTGIRSDDPADTPAHLFYFTWSDVARDDEIAVVENRLLPPIDPQQSGSFTAAGYTQQLKLTQFPLATTSAFSKPLPPSITVVETAPGGSGRNEEQTLVVPPTAMGSVALSWAGASTKTMAVATLTAVQIAGALNALVTGGDTNPSFAVEERKGATGRRFAVEFVGPLAAAAQVPLSVTMREQSAWPWAEGVLDLAGNRGIEQALNGAKECDLIFELVIDNEETYLKPLKVANNLTTGETASSALEQGLIDVVTRIEYVDAGLGSSFVEASPGLSFTPPSAGSAFNFGHTFTSYLVSATVFQKTSDSPERWRECDPTEYGASNPDDSHVIVTLPFALSDAATIGGAFNPLYKGNWRVLLKSPNTELTFFQHQHTWGQVRDSLPSGQTVAAKFAALDAALGVFGGALRVNASNINGQLTSAQIDIASFAAALQGSDKFTAALVEILKSSTSVMDTIGDRLKTSTVFSESLKTLLSQTDVVSTLSQTLTKDATFAQSLRSIIYSVIQSGSLPGGATFRLLPDFSAVVPPWEDIPGPARSVQRPKTVVTSSVVDGVTTTTTHVEQETVQEPTTFPIYFPLSPAVPNPVHAGSVLEGTLPLVPLSSDPDFAVGKYNTVGPAGAESRSSPTGRPRGQSFAPGANLYFAAGHWYGVVVSGSTAYPTECEMILVRDAVSRAEMLAPFGARYALQVPLTIGLPGNVEGRIELVAEIANRTAIHSGEDVDAVTWTPLFARELRLSPATLVATLELVITRTSLAAFEAQYTLFGLTTILTGDLPELPAQAFDLRVKLGKFDTAAHPDPRGSLVVNVTRPLASIIPLTAA